MKKIFSTLFVGMALLSFSSCADSDYDEKYADPSKTQTVGIPQVFTGVMYNGNTYMNPVYTRYWMQSTTAGTFSGVIGNSNGKGRFMGAGEGYFNTRWVDFYNMVTQFRLLEHEYNKLEDAEKGTYDIFIHLSRAMVYSQLHEMLSLFGDVPYNGTGTLWATGDYDAAKKLCTYDDDVALYKQILSDLKASGDYFNGAVSEAGKTALKAQDYSLAAGDVSIWRKYINSLRLRIAIHLSTTGDCKAEAASAIAEILNNPSAYPVVDNNAENMGTAGDVQTDAFNFGKSFSQIMHTGSYANPSQTMLNALNIPADGIPTAASDPRIAVMLDSNPDGEYVSYDVTMSDTEISNLADAKNKEYLDRGMIANYFCKIDSQAVAGWTSYQGNDNLDGLWMGAAEVSLIKAEAYLLGIGVAANEAKAKECFIQGITQSTEYYWNLKETSSLYKEGNDSYNGFRTLVKPTADEVAAYAESAWAPTQEAVATQAWLNHSFMNEHEAWNTVRRTGYPVVEFARDAQMSNYPTPPNRLPYPSDELTYNSENCQAAIATNYKESTGYYTNLFWAKENYYTLVK